MEIDNQYDAGKFRMFYAIALALILFPMGYFLLVDPRGVEKILSLGMAGAAVLSYVYMLLKNYHFVQFRDTGEEVSVKYFHVHPFIGSKKSVVIPVKQLVQYKIAYKWKGLQYELVLYQRTNRGLAKYPGIPLAGFSRNDYRKLKYHLEQNHHEATQKS